MIQLLQIGLLVLLCFIFCLPFTWILMAVYPKQYALAWVAAISTLVLLFYIPWLFGDIVIVFAYAWASMLGLYVLAVACMFLADGFRPLKSKIKSAHEGQAA